jgi:hypothetical protein
VWIVELLHVLFCMELYWDAQVNTKGNRRTFIG